MIKLTKMKKIVTHINPDLDAVASVWLILRFLPGWQEAEIDFCPAGETLENEPADVDEDVLYVDTGLGRLDHHQTSEYLSAARLCLDYVVEKRRGKQLSLLNEEALGRMVEVVTQVDNARDLNWKEVGAARHDFYLHNIIGGIRGMAGSDQETMDHGLKALDAVFHNLKNRIRAEEEIKNGVEFKTPWGKALAVETGNEQVLWEGEKAGYCLVVKKDPKEGGVRIYSRWDTDVDLTKVYNKVRKLDPESDWFLHSSKKLLLNAASGKKMQPTKLSLKEMMEVLGK